VASNLVGPIIGTRASRPTQSAGHLSLDFVNTGAWDAEGPWHERLVRYRDLVRWAREAGAILPERSSPLLEAAERQPRPAEQALQRAIGVRLVLHDIFHALADERPVSAADLAALSQSLAAAVAGARLLYRDGRIVREWSAQAEELDQVLRPIVTSAVDLLLSERSARVRSCANPHCGRVFLDESRNGMRRWCDMRVCGSRAKARRYYARHVVRDRDAASSHHAS
jgi:predicted RNA-binding Zn ribbon-like protein